VRRGCKAGIGSAWLASGCNTCQTAGRERVQHVAKPEGGASWKPVQGVANDRLCCHDNTLMVKVARASEQHLGCSVPRDVQCHAMLPRDEASLVCISVGLNSVDH